MTLFINNVNDGDQLLTFAELKTWLVTLIENTSFFNVIALQTQLTETVDSYD